MRHVGKRIWVLVFVTALAAHGRCLALDEMNWAPRNHAVLSQFLRDHGKGSCSYDPKKPPYAVFDWDDTSAFHDCGEALFRHQLWNLAFRLDKRQFRSFFKDKFKDGRARAGSREVKLGDVHQDVIAAYTFLHDRYGGLGGSWGLDDLRETPQFQDFVSKMLFLSEAYGPEHGYVWMLWFLANYTPDEARALARAAIKEQLGESLRRVTWRGPRGFDSKAGPIDVTFRGGLRVHPEMQGLMAGLRAAGIDVYVVTASLKQAVEVFAGRGGFGYNVPADHVLGMELAVKNGKLQPAYKTGWVRTYRRGKVDAIKRILGKRGEPIFAAGDSDGDYEMLSAFKGTKLSLILNRVRGGDIGKLCRQAVEQQDQKRPRYILQGRDENTGLVVPQQETISPGQLRPRLLQPTLREGHGR